MVVWVANSEKAFPFQPLIWVRLNFVFQPGGNSHLPGRAMLVRSHFGPYPWFLWVTRQNPPTHRAANPPIGPHLWFCSCLLTSCKKCFGAQQGIEKWTDPKKAIHPLWFPLFRESPDSFPQLFSGTLFPLFFGGPTKNGLPPKRVLNH